MTKKATASIDPVCMELVRAGLITYKQLNEVHRIVQETGGSIDDVLVSKGMISKEQLAKRRAPVRPKKKTLKIGYSLDLVKSGLLTFKQLNECHREARGSRGVKTVVDVMLEKGYVSDVQLATLPKPAERAKHKKFSSTWDLFRAGAVSLKALNDCHRHIKLEQPEKSLKEALVERGYITREALDELEKKRAAGQLGAAREGVRSPFMEKYARELEGIPSDLQQELRKEHLASEGISSEEDEGSGEAAPAVAARAQPDDFQDQKTFMDFSEEGEDDTDLQAAKTMLGDDDDAPSSTAEFQSEKTMLGDDDDAPSSTADFQSEKTMLGDDDDGRPDTFQSDKTMMDADEDGSPSPEEQADFRAAKTFLGADDSDEFRAQKTLLGDDEGGDPADFRAAQTFMDAGAEAKPRKEIGTDSGSDIRGARTFMDAGEASETGSNPDLRGARTFMDMGGEEPSSPAVKKAEPNAGSTFMDMDLEVAGAGGMFGTSETASGVGPGMLGAAEGGAKSPSSANVEREGATFMDLENQPAGQTKSAVREAFDRAGKSASGASGTEFDAKAGKSSAGASATSISGKSDPGTSSAGAASASKSSASQTGSKTGATGAGTSTGTGSSTSGTTSKGSSTGGSATEADSEEAKKAKAKKKKDDEDAYKHPLVGKVIGGCRIVKKLGEGGMGAVFLAEHTKLKRQSVIKVVPAHLSQNRQLIARFEREARAAAIVQHPNIVAVYNVGEENGVHYIEMEFVDGSALDSQLKDKKVIEQMECVRIIKDACKGLAEAHKNGIIHRDIKPDNIMMTRKGQVKIADFGLARAGSEEMELTKVGQILGTPAYMSPEQCQGKPTDHRADIYSLGATFYAMITGKRPFTGASVMEIMQKHIDEEPISPREYNPDIAVQVVKIILRMMAKKPDDRFQSSDEVIAAIDQFMKEEGTEHLREVQGLLGDDWKIVKKLGQGGMGAVYSAKSTKAKDRVKEGELVAIKVLNREVNPEEVKRFEQEAKLALEIDHENIIRVLEYKISDSVNYIVMEFIEGKSVRDLIRDQKKLDPKEAVRIVREASKGLGRAHQLGIIHRDIKPDNLMIAKTGAVKVADFGIAKHVEGQSELTQAGVVVGTPHYMSPEQCVGASRGIKITTQADVYSLGATLYFMVTGQKPFEGDTQMTIILQHLNQPPKPPREVDEKIDESLSNVILNMMAKKPKYRYASVEDAVKDLEAAERGKKVKKRKHVDTSFEETGRGKLLVAGAAAGMIAFVTIVLAVTKKDVKTENLRAMDGAFDSGKQSVAQLLAKKSFHQAFDVAKTTADKVVSFDTTHELASGFQSRLDDLKRSAETPLKATDAAAAEHKKKLDAELAIARQKADALQKWTSDEDPSDLRGEVLERYGRSYALGADAKAENFGDSPIVANEEGPKVCRAIKIELNELGQKRLNARVAYVERELVKDKYFQAAAASIEDFQREWAELKVPGYPSEPLTGVCGEAQKQIDNYKQREQATAPGDLGKIENEAFNAFATEARELKRDFPGRKSGEVATKRIVKTFRDAKAKTDGLQGAATSFHKRMIDEHLDKVSSILEQTARDEIQKTIDQALRVADEGELGKPVTATTSIERARDGVKDRFGDEFVSRLDSVPGQITKLAAQKWSQLKERLDELAWGSPSSPRGSSRKFFEAERVYRAVVADPESLHAIPTADGKNTITLRQLAKDELGALEYNLEILRPYSETNIRGMVPVAAGVFAFGDDRVPNQRPRSQRTLPGFYIDRTEVTVEQYQHFLRTDKRTGRYIEPTAENAKRELFLCGPHDPDPRFCYPGEPRSETGHAPPGIFDAEANKPVAFVNWYDAYAFANWAGKRLPHETEWEKAASWDSKDGLKRRFPWGDAWNPANVVCSGPDDQWPDLPPVGSKDRGASPCGALDMAGSLWEWVDEDFAPYQGGRAEDDPDFNHGFKVIRGGSYQNYRDNAFQGSYRDRGDPRDRKANVGFRCMRDEGEKK